MQLSAIGQIAQEFWVEIPNHFNHTFIDAYIVMPNHVHGIVIIDHPVMNHFDQPVETRYITSLQTSQNKNDQSNNFSPLKPGSLQAIIHSFPTNLLLLVGVVKIAMIILLGNLDFTIILFVTMNH